MQLILQWIDLIWLPVALFAVHKNQRAIAGGYILSCALMLRLQGELILSTGFANGFTGMIDMSAFVRGQIVYSIFHVIYIILAIYSEKSEKVIMLAASISIFFAALCLSMIVMAI